jgi:hypothetical protein
LDKRQLGIQFSKVKLTLTLPCGSGNRRGKGAFNAANGNPFGSIVCPGGQSSWRAAGARRRPDTYQMIREALVPVPTEKGVELMAQRQAIALNMKPKRKPAEYMDLRFANEVMAELGKK